MLDNSVTVLSRDLPVDRDEREAHDLRSEEEHKQKRSHREGMLHAAEYRERVYKYLDGEEMKSHEK
jgi:hypothetical protein